MKQSTTSQVDAPARRIACENGASAPEWILLVPMGQVRSSKGDFLVDEAAMGETIAAFRAMERDLVLDYEHQTLTGQEAPAAGWIRDLEARADGLWARVEWTERGAGYVERREYRYLSPVVMVRGRDRRMVAIHSVGLTNDPAIVGMRAIVNKRTEEEGMDPKRIAEVLGLAPEAGEEEILAAVGRMKAQVESVGQALALKDGQDAASVLQALVEFRRGVTEALGIGADAPAAEVRGTVLALKNPSGVVSLAEFQALKERLCRREAEDLVEMALKAGKVTPANRDWAMTYALKDRAGFEAFLQKAPVVVPQGMAAGAGRAGAQEGTLEEAEMLVCRQLGLTPDQWKKHNTEEA